jgi:hypothetical protein
MSYVEDCQELLASIDQEYAGDDYSTIVNEAPEKVLQNSTMVLWANSSDDESRHLNLRLPTVKRFLERLASYGVGHREEFQGVIYMFVKRGSLADNNDSHSR